jgi:hypothetical protein
MFTSWMGLIASLCLGGFQVESALWMANKEKKFDLVEAFKFGFREPFNINNPMPHLFKDKEYDESYQYTFKDFLMALSSGSWGDRYKIFSRGYTLDVQFPTWAPQWFVALATKLFSIVPKTPGVVRKFNAVIAASWPALLYDYTKIMSIMSIGTYIVSMNKTLNQLYNRVVDVATCFNAIKNINNLIEKSPAIAHNNYMIMEYDDRISECLNKLAAPRFAQKGSYLYSRGNVLSMHKEIKGVKRSLVPLLQSVAFLDAFCSIAQLYKESQSQPVKFSFPEFVPSQKPFFSYTDAWLPLLSYNEAVTNDLCLGRDGGCPGKIVIVGPNGGGKSTLLKTYGIAVILAQSWLIIPASHGSQTLFAQIKTALDTREDSKNKLSLGMAVMKKMNELFVAMQKSDGQKKKMLVLIDEPYKGFVDDEAADRIYEFGKNITEFSNVLLAMATHTKKPIMLEVDTNGIFGNYHVKIDELSIGVFKRLFKIEKGPSMWWFEDSSKRRRFTDWLNTELAVYD